MRGATRTIHCSTRGAVRVLVLLGAAFALLSGAGTAHAETGISGTWSCCGEGGAAEQNFVIVDSQGTLSGKGVLPGGSSFAVISGSVSAGSVKIVTTYEASFAAGYVATFLGTLAADGQSMSGTWSSNAGQSGTWTAELQANSAPSSGTGMPSSVGVEVLVGEDVTADEEGSIEGIPIVLMNPEPDPAFVETTLTVQGYPPIANSDSLSRTAGSARVQVIGHAHFSLAAGARAHKKVELSKGASRLLRRRKRLAATLTVVTKVPGHPNRTSRHKLELKV